VSSAYEQNPNSLSLDEEKPNPNSQLPNIDANTKIHNDIESQKN
jgi:hypothetical protein